MDNKVVILALLWVLWCAVHSGMISMTATGYLKRRMGRGWCFYRLFYNLFSIVSLIPVVLYWHSLTGPTLFSWQGPMIVLRVLLLTLAILLFYAGAKKYDILSLLGLKQIREGATTALLTETDKLDATGVLGITRHPWYLAAILFIWAAWRELDPAILVTNTVLSAYLVIGTLLEERKLLLEFNGEYRRYQKEVSMLVPFKFLSAQFNRLRE
ncbi:NnrU family protein [Gemmatimonadota bacterium]